MLKGGYTFDMYSCSAMLLYRYLDKLSLCSRSFSHASINVFDWTLVPVYFLNAVVAVPAEIHHSSSLI